MSRWGFLVLLLALVLPAGAALSLQRDGGRVSVMPCCSSGLQGCATLGLATCCSGIAGSSARPALGTYAPAPKDAWRAWIGIVTAAAGSQPAIAPVAVVRPLAERWAPPYAPPFFARSTALRI